MYDEHAVGCSGALGALGDVQRRRRIYVCLLLIIDGPAGDPYVPLRAIQRRSGEVVRQPPVQGFDHIPGRQAVEGGVHLYRIELPSVEAQPVRAPDILGIESSLPVIVDPAGRPDVDGL